MNTENSLPRFFIKTDSANYVTGMYVACSTDEAEQYESDAVAEVTPELYSSIGPNSKYENGDVVEGTPRATPLTAEDALLIQQSLIDTAMKSINVIQLKLQAGRTLTDAERSRLNATLDYIDAVEAIDTSTAPDITWSVQPA